MPGFSSCGRRTSVSSTSSKAATSRTTRRRRTRRACPPTLFMPCFSRARRARPPRWQDALNIYFEGRWHELEQKWNAFPVHFSPEGPVVAPPLDELRAAVVLHGKWWQMIEGRPDAGLLPMRDEDTWPWVRLLKEGGVELPPVNFTLKVRDAATYAPLNEDGVASATAGAAGGRRGRGSI